MLVIVARWAKYIENVRSCGKMRCRDSTVSIVTSYGIDDSGFYPRWGKVIFSSTKPVQTSPGATQLPSVGAGALPGGKAAGAWR